MRFDEPNTNDMTPVFQTGSVNQNVEEIRDRCEPKKTRKEVCVTRVEEVDDVEHEKSEE